MPIPDHNILKRGIEAMRGKSLIAAIACAIVCLPAIGAPAFSGEPQHYDLAIDRQPLGRALQEFAKQSGVQIIFFSKVTEGYEAPPLKGRYTATDALTTLLDDSTLTFHELNPRTIEIRPRAAVLLETSGASSIPFTEVNGANGLAATLLSGADAYIRLAQNEQTSTQSEGSKVSTSSIGQEGPSNSRDGDVIDEVVVTGSHIRGAADPGANVIVIDRAYIDQSGYRTLPDVLKTLPQNFGGGVTEDFTTEQNFTDATAVNLRGLGSDSTLVLIDGRRQPAGGVNGTFVDISSIPVAAIDRVEVLPDGASAIYGSDAIGGVVNIMLRKDFEGAETTLNVGMYGSDATETQISQLFGTKWDRGHALIGYQYQDREVLQRVDRAYSADTDQRSNGGTNFSAFTSSPGNILDPVTRQPAYAIPSGQDGRSLTSADLLPGVTNFQNGAIGSDLLGEQSMHSAFLAGALDLTESVELFVDGRYSKRENTRHVGGHARTLVIPSTNAFYVNPFTTSTVRVAYNFLNDFGPVTREAETETYVGTLGGTADVGEHWQVVASGSYGNEHTRSHTFNQANSAALTAALADNNPATAFNAFGDGGDNNPATLDALRFVQRDGADSDLWTASLVADGRIIQLPGGDLRLAIGADYRREGLVAGVVTPTDLSREVHAGFAELAVPIVGASNALPAVQALDLSLAGRYESYSDFGSTFNPRAGLRWRPLDTLALRGSWGTSFKAPSLIELTESVAGNFDQLFALRDPSSPTGQSLSLVRFGNNAELEEETATIWTAGIDIVAPARPGSILSLTYFHIDFEDRIARGGPSPNFLDILFFEDQWSELIVRNPSTDEVAAICSGPRFLGAPADCVATPPAAIVDFRLRNLAVVQVRGIDLDLRHTIHMATGSLRLGLTGTYVLQFDQALNDASAPTSVLDTLNNPTALRLRGSLSWTRAGWGAQAAVNYTDDYRDVASQPHREIKSWTTLDIGASYRFADAEGGWLNGAVVALNVVNVFDSAPPFANVSLGYDAANADPLGRTLSLQISKQW